MFTQYPAPVAIFAAISLFFLFFSRQAKGLKCVLVASYCGVWVISFTAGVMGAIWLAPLFLILIGLVAVWRPPGYAFDSRVMSKLTYTLFFVFFVGVWIALLRFDPEIEFQKAGQFRTILGLPLRYLMATYRVYTISFLFLAFALPLRYYVDRKVFLQCLVLCWVFSMVLAILTILNQAKIGHFGYTAYAERGVYRHMMGVLGFFRGGQGIMLATGIFMSFAMTQLTRSYNLKVLGYGSIPILIIALLLSFSRTAVLCVIVGGLSLAVTLGGARALKGILVFLLGAIVVYIVVLQIPEVRERLGFLQLFYQAGLEKKSAIEFSAVRVTGWITHIKWVVKSPGILAVGAGFQNFSYFVSFHAQIGRLAAGHNNWLHILTESGIVGLFVFNAWLISIFYWLVSWRRTMTDKVDKMIPGIFISLMMGLLASCMTSEVLSPFGAVLPSALHFYILLGIWTSYYRTQMMELSAEWVTEIGDYAYDEMQQPELEPYNA